MSESTTTAAGLSFADLSIGMETFNGTGVTVTRERIASFVEISTDASLPHTSDEFARSIGFEGIIAHGALSLSIATGLASNLGFTKEGVVFRRFKEWEFIRTVKPGDELRLKMKVLTLDPGRATKPRTNPPTAEFEVTLLNQDNRVVQKGVWVAEFRPLRAM